MSDVNNGDVKHDIRYWFIQKPISNNCPINQGSGVAHEAAVFTDFEPTVSVINHEWIKVFSLDDFHKAVGINISRYITIMRDNSWLQKKYDTQCSLLNEAREALEHIAYSPTRECKEIVARDALVKLDARLKAIE